MSEIPRNAGSTGRATGDDSKVPKFVLGKGSLQELTGVHPDLVRVVKRAIELTTQDFSVHDGIRTLAEQKELFKKKATQTMDSRHLTGHAVDLVPFINGKVRWEWPPIYEIAEAVRQAAKEAQVPIRWGGAWDIRLTDTDDSPEDLVRDYSNRRRKAKKKVFLDGPHFELPKDLYP